jgi:hypothetical protein
MTEKKDGYNVVFRYTKAAGGYEGVRYIIGFSSKEDFDKWLTPDARVNQEVVEEGVSGKRAQELVNETPIECYIASAIEDAKMQDGSISFPILEMKLDTIIFCMPEEKRGEAQMLANLVRISLAEMVLREFGDVITIVRAALAESKGESSVK